MVRAWVVRRAVTLRRLPRPFGAHRVLVAGTRRLAGNAALRIPRRPAGPAGGSLGAVRAPGRVGPGQRAALSGGAGWPGGNVTVSPEGSGAFLSEVFVIKSSLDPRLPDDRGF